MCKNHSMRTIQTSGTRSAAYVKRFLLRNIDVHVDPIITDYQRYGCQ